MYTSFIDIIQFVINWYTCFRVVMLTGLVRTLITKLVFRRTP